MALLMPSQNFMKTVLENTPDISNAELVAVMSHAAKMYARYFVNGHLQNPSPAGTDWTLEEALGCCESFYVAANLLMFQMCLVCACITRRDGV